MSDNKKISEFIRLRIEGTTFEEIADQLKVSNSTLISWNKDLSLIHI